MNAKQVWQAALGELQLKVPGPSFQTWLRTTSISEFRDGAVVIAVPSNFAREWLEKRFTKVITETLNNILGREVDVQFEVKAPPRGESSRIVHALDGIGAEALPRELPMAAGQQVSNPYRDGIHPASMSSMAHLTPNEPTNINAARGGDQQGAASNGQSGNMTNLVRTNPGSSNMGNRTPPPPIQLVKPGGSQGASQNRGAMQMQMSMEEASMLNPRYSFDRFIVGKSNQLAHA